MKPNFPHRHLPLTNETKMKNKRNTYLLFAIVVIVWGIISYKILNTLYPNKETVKPQEELADFQPKPVQEQHTFTVSAHQRDPFLGTFNLPETKHITSGSPKAVSKKKEEMSKIPIIFSGMITDKTSKEKIFFVSISSQQYVMRINDEVQQVKLLKGDKKAIRVKYNNQLKTIPITR